MTTQSAFNEEEWKAVREAPTVAGMVVVTASRGGSFRESFALAKAYAEARQQHGESELLDEIVATKPQFDRHRFGSPEALHDDGLQLIRDTVAVLGTKATPEEVEDYRGFVLALAQRVAAAHKESGERVSPDEQAAMDEIAAALGSQGSQP
jgi:hypothetical protein